MVTHSIMPGLVWIIAAARYLIAAPLGLLAW
jgi:hypothetical protein